MKTQHHTLQSGRSQSPNLRAVWLTSFGCWAVIATPALVSAKPSGTKRPAAKVAVAPAAKAKPVAAKIAVVPKVVTPPTPALSGQALPHVDVRINARVEAQTSRGATYNLPLGRVLQFQPPAGFAFRVDDGIDNIHAVANGDILSITPQHVGRATIIVDAPNNPPQTYLVRVVDNATEPAAPVVATPDVAATASAAAPAGTTTTTMTTTSVATTPVTVTPAMVTPAQTPAAVTTPSALPGDLSVPAVALATQTITSDGVPNPAVPTTTLTTPAVAAPSLPDDAVRVSPAVQPPSHLPNGTDPFPTRSRFSPQASTALRTAPLPRNAIQVSQGLARLLSFSSNILSVYFSDVNVMDARAVNARTVALTGLAPGISTLAVFSERFAGDTVGRANIYQISVRPQGASSTATQVRDPAVLESAIRSALNDSRINVSVLQLPGGSNAVRLTGTVRDTAELEAARSTASLFVPNVISSIYVDKDALRPGATAPLDAEDQLQARLRQVTSNDSIELVSLPTGLALKASVNSAEEAEALLNLIPSLNQRVVPFIVIRGGASSTPYRSDRPVLTGENAEMTQVLQSVIGITTIYVTRTALNGLAVYGTVRNRTEYDTLRRYASILPQIAAGTAPASGAARTNLPAVGDVFQNGVQLFVRILDPAANVARRVTVDTSVVEITRTAMKNLGVELGSATVTSEGVTGGNTVVTPGAAGQPNIVTQNPLIITRQIDPTFNAGQIVAGNGFSGLGSSGIIDPVRLRISALYSNGNIRLLSNPNISALDGTEAQITIGGARPILSTTVVGGTGAAVQNIIFRKYGIILTMRPSVTDDETIILQMRADITNIDPTTSINVNGAIIPGETVRSVDSTLAVREGDMIVMGGLMTNERNVQISRFPILSQLPIFGPLFQSKRYQNNQSELAIFMTPHISRLPVTGATSRAVESAASLPPLPSTQVQNNPFGGSTSGNGSGG